MISSSDVKHRASDLGFDLCGVAPAVDLPELEFLATWIGRRYYGTMTWLPRTARVRRDVRHILPSARVVIATATLYNTDRPYAAPDDAGDAASVSRYAWGEDYHRIVGERLDMLMAWLAEQCGPPFEGRRYVDTGPVQERVYARHAGLGWIGKNTCLINPALGSWLFLGAIICNLDLEPDTGIDDLCGNCQLCLQACPTGALVEPRVLDARACISYLTIEKRGTIDPALRAGMGSHIYGCDICQEVCPYNSRAAVTDAFEWQPRSALDRPSLASLWHASDEELGDVMDGSPMMRVTVPMLRRNLAIAIGNSGMRALCALLDERDDPGRPSLADAAVLDAVAWARARLDPAAPPATGSTAEDAPGDASRDAGPTLDEAARRRMMQS